MHRASARHISVFDWVLLPGKPKPVDEEEQVRPEQPLRQLPRPALGRRRRRGAATSLQEVHGESQTLL